MFELLLVSQTFFLHPLISHLFLWLAFTVIQQNHLRTHTHTHLSLHLLINSSPLLTHRSFTPIHVLPLTGRSVLGSNARVCACLAHLCSLWFPCVQSSPCHSDRWRIPSYSHSSHSDRCLGSVHTHPHLDTEGKERVEQCKNVNLLNTTTLKETFMEMNKTELAAVDLVCQTGFHEITYWATLRL